MKKIVVLLFCLVSALHANPGRGDFLKDQVCTLLPSLEGWCSKEKAISFIDLVLDVEPEVCVEIGVFGGASLLPVASALRFLRKGIVVGIDPWDKSEAIKYFDPLEEQADLEWWSTVDMDLIFTSYRTMLKRYGLDSVCVTMKATSERAATCLRVIDILHIDGNHSEYSSIKDVSLYLPLVRSGGYVWINDAMGGKKQQAIDLLFETCDFVKSIDGGNCILFQKR